MSKDGVRRLYLEGVNMKAVVFHGVGDIRLDNVRDQRIEQPTDAIVRMTASAICGTDLHFVRGTVPGMWGVVRCTPFVRVGAPAAVPGWDGGWWPGDHRDSRLPRSTVPRAFRRQAQRNRHRSRCACGNR